jgi:hypothetical protein
MQSGLQAIIDGASAAVTATLVALAIGLRATPTHALAACATNSLAACCKINKPGLYSLASALNVTGGDCIDITVPGVVLELGNHDLHQHTQGSGIGIHVLATAPGTIVNGGADPNITDGSQGFIKGFKTGIQNDAPGSFMYLFSGAAQCHRRDRQCQQRDFFRLSCR